MVSIIHRDIFPLKDRTVDKGVYHYTSIHFERITPQQPIQWNAFQYLRSITITSGNFKNEASFELNGLEVLETVTIGQDCFQKAESTFILENLSSLKSITIGRNSFSQCKSFKIAHLPNLTTVVLEYASFGGVSTSATELNSPVLMDLPKLKSLTFGKNTFMYFSSPDLQNLPALTQLFFDEDSFSKNSSNSIYVIPSLPALKSVVFGKNSFACYSGCSILSIPVLESITFKNYTFAGKGKEEETTSQQQQEGQFNGLVIKACPMLREINLAGICFQSGEYLLLEGTLLMIMIIF